MNLHEYQSKELFELYNLPVSKRGLITKLSDIDNAIENIDFTNGCMAKVQAHTGGRGKVGGVEVCKTKKEIEKFVNNWLGKKIVTNQTDDQGLPVNIISIDELTSIQAELYMSLIVDRAEKCVSMIVSRAGGVNIEEVAETNPEKILKIKFQHGHKIDENQLYEVCRKLEFNSEQSKQFHEIANGCKKLFLERDLSLLEINPLVITSEGHLHCLDAKINIDENALYRQEDILSMRDSSQEDEREHRAKKHNLSYVSLDGNIGCMVNGAGLAMGTMDTIKLYNGDPANFLDVGGTATKERVGEALKLILSDKNVKGILVNIFGGIVRCDLIAEGIIGAINEIEVDVPIVVRLQGNMSTEGKELLNSSGLNVIGEDSLMKASQKIVELVK